MPDPLLLMVRPERFDAHLAMLRRTCTPMALSAMVAAAEAGTLPERAVALTFDDGYADNVRHALPLLERHEVPATVFTVSGMVGEPTEFWWDELERLVLCPGSLPERLCLTIAGESFETDLQAGAVYGQDEADRYAAWSILLKEDPSPRHALYRTIYFKLLRLPDAGRWDVLRQLREQAGKPVAGRETHRVMTADEVRRLDASTQATVGAHTVHHPRLSNLPPEAQRSEISGSLAQLEGLLQRRVGEFSYPYGGKTDYDEHSVRIVRECGFDLAVSNFPGLITRGTDALQLPRHLVRDWTVQELQTHMEEWFAA